MTTSGELEMFDPAMENGGEKPGKGNYSPPNTQRIENPLFLLLLLAGFTPDELAFRLYELLPPLNVDDHQLPFVPKLFCVAELKFPERGAEI